MTETRKESSMTKYTNGTRKEELEKLVNAHKKLSNVTYGLIALLFVALITAILKTMHAQP